MAHKVIQVGTGGFGSVWCNTFLPANVEDGLIEVVALVDKNPDALESCREHLGLSMEKCYTDVRRAMDETPAHFCTIVVPPAHHEEIVDEALAHDLHILSEKPIADTLEASVRIAEKVKRAGKKMGVTMSHRFDQDKTTLRQELRSGRWGALDYLICRFSCDCRKYGSWGEFRHQIPDTLMIEGAVHHLDILADLAGGRCDTIYAQTWNPSWGEFAGDSDGLVLMTCENDVKAFYEGAKTNAVGMNGWSNEYIRAECQDATLILDHRHLEAFHYDKRSQGVEKREGQGTTLPMLEQRKWANAWLIDKFVRWISGGKPMETNVEDNLQSVALVFAAIESSRTGQAVKVQEFLAKARAEVSL